MVVSIKIFLGVVMLGLIIMDGVEKLSIFFVVENFITISRYSSTQK